MQGIGGNLIRTKNKIHAVSNFGKISLASDFLCCSRRGRHFILRNEASRDHKKLKIATVE